MTASDTLDDDALFSIIEDDDAPGQAAAPAAKCWRVLIVDDDPEVHAATRFALGQCDIVGRTLQLLSAYSAAEGKEVLDENPDVAVVLLDVVMEEHDAGLKFVEWMRGQGYEKQRIILRTGQPGYAPELEIIRNYDINDYRTKSELTQTRLITAMTAAIRTFEQFWVIEAQRSEMENFAYALAHDFKQTTRQIKVYSDMLARDAEEAGETPETQALAFLNGAARRLGSLVNVMSNYTLMNRPTPVEHVELEAVFADLRSASEQILKDTGGALSIQGSGACLCNPSLLTHVLLVLVANGLQHNESASPGVDISVAHDSGFCTITVRDNGVGIERKYLEEIFKPRMRLRASEELPGTGLGLTLSRSALEAQGASIWCESEPGKGSEFRVRLPTSAARPLAA
ncbi:MAG: response regulator [Alphaproteobacteria bacterium]|nr:response regulator [Alphaproteobacteria bacterium]